MLYLRLNGDNRIMMVGWCGGDGGSGDGDGGGSGSDGDGRGGVGYYISSNNNNNKICVFTASSNFMKYMSIDVYVTFSSSQ